MKASSPVLVALAVGSIVALAHGTSRAEGDLVKYTVQRGDTCSAIAARQFGDARLVELIHEANPGMGPTPHSLKPGRVLLLPAERPAWLEGPDARLTRMKNEVEVSAPDPRPGKPNDPLFKGNRVGTKERSTADVTFRDETQVKLGENTLVVILGDARASAARVGVTDATLVTGSLRARLSELAGKRSNKPLVATSSGAVEVKGGEAQVSVDAKKTTRVAVYDGLSTLTARKKTVDVADGFGSKAEAGRPPTPPKPLPDAPEWKGASAPLVLTDATTDLVFAFDAPSAASGPPAASWHVQLATDSAFDELVVDARVPLETRAIEAKGAGPGTYFARASAIDADAFEGKWSAVGSSTVAVLAATPLPGRRTRIVVTPASVTCAVGAGDALASFEIDRATDRTIRCGARDGTTATLAMAALPPETPGAARPLSPAAEAPAIAERGDGPRVELTAAGRITRVLEQPGFGGSVGARIAVPMARGAFLAGAEGLFEAVPPGVSAVQDFGDHRVRADVWGVRAPIGFRIGHAKRRIAPYVTFGPEILWTRAQIGPESTRIGSRSITAGGGAAAGVEWRVGGASAVYGEASGRVMMDVAAEGTAIDPSAVGLAIGYRLAP